MAKGATTGAKRTAPFIVGLVIGELIFFGLALAGLAVLAAALGPLFAVIKWMGIAYLLYLAVTMWRAPAVQVSHVMPQGEGLKLLIAGTLLLLGNPMTIGFYLALVPTVLDLSAISAIAALEMAFTIIAVWGGVLLGYTALADRAGRLIATPNAQKWLNRTAAGAMLGAAGAIAARR